MKLKIGVDLDGCVYPFVDQLRKYVHLVTGRPYDTMPNASCWEFYEKDWGYTLKEFLRFCDDAVNEGMLFRHGTPMPGSKQAIDRFRKAGHEIHFVTARNFGWRSSENTAFWLSNHRFQFESLVLNSDKTCIKTDIFIDDRPKNVDELREAGVSAWLLDNQRNDQVGHKFWIKNWSEFEFLVNQKAGTLL